MCSSLDHSLSLDRFWGFLNGKPNVFSHVFGVNVRKGPRACWCFWGWGGVGWAALRAFIEHFHTYVMLRYCAFSCTSTHTSRYATVRSLALSHIRHATLLCVLLPFRTYVMLRSCAFSCTSTHTSCYATVRSLALSHIRHATLLCVLLPFRTYVMLRYCAFSCTSTHTSSYATVRSLTLSHIRHTTLLCVLLHLWHTSCYGTVRSLALPHIRHATLLCVLLPFRTYVMLRYCAFSCPFAHTSCYGTVRSLALPHIRHATLLCVLLPFRTYVILRYCAFSCTFDIRHAMLLWPETQRQHPRQTWRTFCLKNRSAKLLQEGPGSRNVSIFVVKHTIFQFWGNPSIENEPQVWWRKLNMCKLHQMTSNYHSFGHLMNLNVTRRCHHRHGPLQRYHVFRYFDHQIMEFPVIPAGFHSN